VDEAPVQHAEYDIDSNQSGEQEWWLLASCLVKRLDATGEIGVDDIRKVEACDRALNHRRRGVERGFGRNLIPRRLSNLFFR